MEGMEGMNQAVAEMASKYSSNQLPDTTRLLVDRLLGHGSSFSCDCCGIDSICLYDATLQVEWSSGEFLQRVIHLACSVRNEIEAQILRDTSETAPHVSNREAEPDDNSETVDVEGDVVVLLINDGLPLALAEVCMVWMGYIFVPLSPHDPIKRRQQLLNLLKPRWVLESDFVMRSVNAKSGDLPPLQDILLAWDNNISSSITGKAPAHQVSDPNQTVMYTIFTSGTSGFPKGVVVEFGQLQAYLESISPHLLSHTRHFPGNPCIKTKPQPRVLMLSASTFDPSIGDIFGSLLFGATLITATRWQIETDVTALIVGAQPTSIVSTPALWSLVGVESIQNLYAPGKVDDSRNLSLRLFLGGEPMGESLARRWSTVPGVFLYNIYGVTEAVVYQALQLVSPGDIETSTCCVGEAIGSSVEIQLGDPSSNNARKIVESGRMHEVILVGDQVARGYLKGKKFLGHWNTGDLICCDEVTSTSRKQIRDSPLLFVGRTDFQIKINGQRGNLQELEYIIEEALGSKLVKKCVMTCCKRPLTATVGESKGAPMLVATLVFNCCVRPYYATAISMIVQSVLQPAFCPATFAAVLPEPDADVAIDDFVVLPHLPLSTNGKVDRKQLVRDLEARLASSPMDAPRPEGRVLDLDHSSEIECIAATVWEQILRVPIRRKSHFLLLGGDSLTAQRVTKHLIVKMYGTDESISKFGVVEGDLSAAMLMKHPQFTHYCEFLGRSIAAGRITAPLKGKHFNPTSPQGEDENILMSPGNDILIQCAQDGDLILTEVVLRCDIADVNVGSSRTRRLTTPLHISSAQGNLELCSLLLEYGARPTQWNAERITPGHLAAQSSQRLLKLLLDHGLPMHVRDGSVQSLLHFAARAGADEIVSFLLQTDSKVLCSTAASDRRRPQPMLGIRDRWERAPVHWAILNGHTKTVKLLVEAELDLGDDLRTPLDFSVNKKTSHERLAKKRTNLPYETPFELAKRLYGDDSPMTALCNMLQMQ